MSQIILNEKHLGDRVTRPEINAAIDYLRRRGYSVGYGEFRPGAARAFKPRHWAKATKAAHQAAAEQAKLPDFATLSLAEQAAKLAEINCFLSEQIIQKLFAEQMPLQPMPEQDEFLSAVMQEVAEVLNG